MIPAEELIQLTKDWVSTFNGVSEKQAATLSEEFVFRGPGEASPDVLIPTIGRCIPHSNTQHMHCSSSLGHEHWQLRPAAWLSCS